MDTPEISTEAVESVELGDYLKVLRERKWVILGTVLAILAAVLAMSLLSTPKYRATSQILRQRANLDSALFGSSVFEFRDVQRELQTGASLVKLDVVAKMVKDQLGSPRSPGELLSMVQVNPAGQTDLVNIAAVSTYPDEAAKVSNAFAEQFIQYRRKADQSAVTNALTSVSQQYDAMTPSEKTSDRGTQLADKLENLRILEQMQTGGFEIAQVAKVPGAPFSPQPFRNGVLALAVGLVVGVGLAFLLEYLDKRIKDEETLEREFGLPVLASVPTSGKRWTRKEGDRSTAPVGFLDNRVPLIESYRSLRSSLQYFEVDGRLRSILVTSALPQEGKTITTINLALSLALSGARVIIIEGDLRRPMVHKYLELGNEIGVSNVLAGSHTFSEAMQLVEVDDFTPPEGRRTLALGESPLLQKNLYCITAGPLPPNPAELAASARMQALIQKASDTAEYVLIDSPPLLLVADGLSLATFSDATIIAARMYHTTSDEAREVRALLGRAGVHAIGVVASGVKAGKSYYRRYGYYSTGRENA